MKRYIAFAALTVFAFCISCATMPEKVDNANLVEMTPEQTAQIQQIDLNVIKKRDERIAADKVLSVSEELIAVSYVQVEALEVSGKLLEAQRKLYSAQEAQDKVAAALKNITLNTQRIVQEKANTDYLKAARSLAALQKELRELELAVLLAQSDLIKAQAAFAFQTKRQEKPLIKVELYQKYYDDLNTQLKSKQEDEKKAIELAAKEKDILAKTGYGVQ